MEPVPRICKCCNKPFIDNKTKGRTRNYCSIVCSRRQMQRNYHKNRIVTGKHDRYRDWET